ncbi:hypothetical protein Hanom_Chr13g01215631 [Helianthus anomalus]
MEVPRETYYKNVKFDFCEDDESTDEIVSKEIERLLGDNQEKVENKGKKMVEGCKEEISKSMICESEVEMPEVKTVGQRTNSRLVKETQRVMRKH